MHNVIGRVVLFSFLGIGSACALDSEELLDESADEVEPHMEESEDPVRELVTWLREGELPEVVRIDGSLFAWDEYRANFGELDLHWIVTDEVVTSRTPTAFTTEAARDAFLGIPEGALVSAEAEVAADPPLRAKLWEHHSRSEDGRIQEVRMSRTLETVYMNDRTSSMRTFAKDVVVYDRADRTGCSLFVQRRKIINHMGLHTFCGNPLKGWNDRISAITVVN